MPGLSVLYQIEFAKAATPKKNIFFSSGRKSSVTELYLGPERYYEVTGAFGASH